MTNSAAETFVDSTAGISAANHFPADKVGGWLSGILQSSFDGVIVIDSRSNIVLLNQEAARIFDYRGEDLLERPLYNLLPVQLRSEHAERLTRCFSVTTSEQKLKVRLSLTGLRASGDEIALESSISRVVVRSEIFLVIIFRARPALVNAESTSMPSSENVDLRRVAVSSQQAHEDEKRRFSRELYDDLGQRLSVLKLDLDWMDNHFSDADPAARNRMAQMQRLLSNTIVRTKSIASTLRPPLLDDFGLMAAIDWLTEDFQKRTTVICSVHAECMDEIQHGHPAESAIFRIVQESLLNVERHARATHVAITIRKRENDVALCIQDDGIGMTGDDKKSLGCLGLTAMQERIYILGGTISAKNQAPNGFAIRASIPIGQPFHSVTSL